MFYKFPNELNQTDLNLLTLEDIRNFYTSSDWQEIIARAKQYIEKVDEKLLHELKIDLSVTDPIISAEILRKIGVENFFEKTTITSINFNTFQSLEYLMIFASQELDISFCKMLDIIEKKELTADSSFKKYLERFIVCDEKGLIQLLNTQMLTKDKKLLPLGEFPIAFSAITDYLSRDEGDIDLMNISKCKQGQKMVSLYNTDERLTNLIVKKSTNSADFWKLLYFNYPNNFLEYPEEFNEQLSNKLHNLIGSFKKAEETQEIATCLYNLHPADELHKFLEEKYSIDHDDSSCRGENIYGYVHYVVVDYGE